LQKEPELANAIKKIIKGEKCDDLRLVERLEAAGLVRRDDKQNVMIFCQLYNDFFSNVLR
jgi:hypothetical protein